jgi:hypothetical protein
VEKDMAFESWCKKLVVVGVATLTTLSVTACASESSSSESSRPYEFKNLVESSEECFSYSYGDNVVIMALVENNSSETLGPDAHGFLRDNGYEAVFEGLFATGTPGEDRGAINTGGAEILPGETGIVYLGVDRRDWTLEDISKVKVVKGAEVLLEEEVDINLSALCGN